MTPSKARADLEEEREQGRVLLFRRNFKDGCQSSSPEDSCLDALVVCLNFSELQKRLHEKMRRKGSEEKEEKKRKRRREEEKRRGKEDEKGKGGREEREGRRRRRKRVWRKRKEGRKEAYFDDVDMR